MKKYFLIIILTLMLFAAILANAGTESSSSVTPTAYAAPTPSSETMTREPVRVPVYTQPAPSRTPSPLATQPAS